jgi:hypothetical protein
MPQIHLNNPFCAVLRRRPSAVSGKSRGQSRTASKPARSIASAKLIEHYRSSRITRQK